MKNSVTLENIRENITEQQGAIKRNAFLAEYIVEAFEKQRDKALAENKQRFISVLNAVALRGADLRGVEQDNIVSLVQIDQSIENNERLSEAVNRTVLVVKNQMTNGLMIRHALVKQRQVAETNKAIRDYSDNLRVQNAKAFKGNTEEISKQYTSPVASLESQMEQFTLTMEALDIADKAKEEGYKNAKEVSIKLKEMTAKMENRLQERQKSGEIDVTPEVKAIEA